MGLGKTLRAAGAGCAIGIFMSSAMPTFGVEPAETGGFQSGAAQPSGQGEVTIADGALGDLQAQVATLASRLEELEKKLEGPLTVKGPLVVTDDSGKPVFTAKAQGAGGAISLIGPGADATLSVDGSAELSLKDSKSSSILTTKDGSQLQLDNGNQHLLAGPANGDMQLSLHKGKTSVDLVAREGHPIVAANDGARSVMLQVSPALNGLSVRNGDSLLAQLGEPGNGNTSLGIYEKGGSKAAVVVGYHANGVPGLSVWEGDNPLANIGKDKEGSGGKVAVFDGGTEVIKLGTTANEIGLHINKDNDVVFAGRGADGPEFSLKQGANKIFNVNSPNGKPQLSLSKDASKKWTMAIDPVFAIAGTDNDKIVAISVGDGNAGVLGLAVKSGEKPRAVIGVWRGISGMGIFDGKEEDPVLSAAAIEGRPGFRVRGNGKTFATLAAKDDKEGELKLFDSTGETVRMGTTQDSGAIALSKAGIPTITLGSTEAKPLPALRAYDGKEIVLVAGALPPGRGVVNVYGGGQLGAGISGGVDGGGSVYVMSKGTEVVSINSTDKPGEGLAVVRGPTGNAVAFLGYGPGGGGNVTAADPSGAGVFSAGFIGGDGPGGACVVNKGVKCLGVGLTGMEGFH